MPNLNITNEISNNLEATLSELTSQAEELLTVSSVLVNEIFGNICDENITNRCKLDETFTDAKYLLLMEELGLRSGIIPSSLKNSFNESIAASCIEDAVRSVINSSPTFTDRFLDLMWLYDMTNEVGMSMSKAAAWLNSSQERMLVAISSNLKFKQARDELIAEFNRRSAHLGIAIDVNNLKTGSIA